MRALLAGPKGGYAKSKKSNSIKCIFLNKSKFWPGKSQKSKFNTWNSEKSNFFTKYIKEVKNVSLISQRVNLVSSKSHKSKKVKTPCRPPLLVLAVNTTGMFLLQNVSEVCRTF